MTLQDLEEAQIIVRFLPKIRISESGCWLCRCLAGDRYRVLVFV